MNHVPNVEKISHSDSPAAQDKIVTAFSTVIKVALAVLVMVLMRYDVALAGHASARGVAMGGAFTGLAMGIDAARYNPANLGLSEYQRTSLELVGIGTNISNNSFTLSEYNKYTGAFLTDDDKHDILSDVPADGLNIAADVEASVLSLSKGSIVVSVSGVGLADANINKDVIDLILNGNSFADTIDLTGSRLDAVAYISAGVSYGTSVYNSDQRQIAVGGTFKYLRGLAVERIVDMEGMATIQETGFTGNGRLIARTATGGSGYALDIGAVAHLNGDYTVGLRLENFLSSLSWTKGTEEHGYIFSFDTMTVDNMSEDYVVSEDFSKDIPGFKTNLPSVINLGLARTSGSLLWAVDWEQGFRQAAGASSKPRISIGLEWWLTALAPLRTGFSTGGSENTSLSFGSGIDLSSFYMDFAVVTGTSLSPYSAKWLNLAFSTGLHF